MPDIYEELGVRKIINAAGTYTVLGGSRMSEQTREDMRRASDSFVEIRTLQEKIHREIARLTHNEAAYVTNGAACALYLAVCAAMQLRRGKPHFYLTEEERRDCNVVLFKAHRNPYDYAIGQAGASYREVGYPNGILPATAMDLEQAIDENTAAVYYVHAVWTPPGALPLAQVLQIAHGRGVPVIVDAAAQLPPLENLWHFTAMGADAALFSGGKDLRGPQSSGLMVGTEKFVGAVASLGFPVYGAGRMLKVGREELVGLYSALRQYMEMDHAARAAWCEEEVQKAVRTLDGSCGFLAERSFPNEAGQPIARALVRVTKPGISAGAVKQALLDGTPSIFVMTEGEDSFYLNPMTLYPGEMEAILTRLAQIRREQNDQEGTKHV